MTDSLFHMTHFDPKGPLERLLKAYVARIVPHIQHDVGIHRAETK
jgi:hypothetical protein